MKTNELKNVIETINNDNVKERKASAVYLAKVESIKIAIEKATQCKVFVAYDVKEGSKASATLSNANMSDDEKIEKAMRFEIYVKRTNTIAYIGNLSPLAKVGIDNPHFKGTSHQFSKTKETRLVYEKPFELVADIENAYKSEEKPKAEESEEKPKTEASEAKPKKASASKRKTTKKAVNKAV